MIILPKTLTFKLEKMVSNIVFFCFKQKKWIFLENFALNIDITHDLMHFVYCYNS